MFVSEGAKQNNYSPRFVWRAYDTQKIVTSLHWQGGINVGKRKRVQTLTHVNLTTRGPGTSGIETAAAFDLLQTSVVNPTASSDRLCIQLEKPSPLVPDVDILLPRTAIRSCLHVPLTSRGS